MKRPPRGAWLKGGTRIPKRELIRRVKAASKESVMPTVSPRDQEASRSDNKGPATRAQPEQQQ